MFKYELSFFYFSWDIKLLVCSDKYIKFHNSIGGIAMVLEELIWCWRNCSKLVKSYLSNRSYKVKINDTLSDAQSLAFGIPQGSILGLILYSLHVKDIKKKQRIIVFKFGFMLMMFNYIQHVTKSQISLTQTNAQKKLKNGLVETTVN